MKIVFFGSRHVAELVWQLNQDFDLKLVVTTDKRLVENCKDEDIPFTQILGFDKRLIEEIKKMEPDLGIVADFGIIIPKEIINLFPEGILNIHPSLLPLYRGPTPVQTAILQGDGKTGITIIKIDEKLDHGPILYQEEREILPTDYTDKLLIALFKRSAVILPTLIEKFVAGDITPVKQDDKKATHTKSLTKEDGYIDVKNPPGKEKLQRMINALNPWPGVWTRFKLTDKEVIIKLHPLGIIHVEAKKPMSYKDFINGYPRGKFFLQKLSLI